MSSLLTAKDIWPVLEALGVPKNCSKFTITAVPNDVVHIECEVFAESVVDDELVREVRRYALVEREAGTEDVPT